MKNIYVSAKIGVKPGSKDAWLNATKANLPLVRAEKGCIRYDLHQSLDNDTFLFYEIWNNADALHAHAHSENMSRYHDATAQLVESVAVETWQAVDILPATTSLLV